jgi:hypothetical protein
MAEIAQRKQIAPQNIETKTESVSIDGTNDKKRIKGIKEEETTSIDRESSSIDKRDDLTVEMSQSKETTMESDVTNGRDDKKKKSKNRIKEEYLAVEMTQNSKIIESDETNSTDNKKRKKRRKEEETTNTDNESSSNVKKEPVTLIEDLKVEMTQNNDIIESDATDGANHKKKKKSKRRKEEESTLIEDLTDEIAHTKDSKMESDVTDDKKKKKSKRRKEEELTLIEDLVVEITQNSEIIKNDSDDKKIKEEETEYKTFKENLYKIENPFKGSNLFDIVGYTPYTVFESLDMLLEDKVRRALKKGKIMARNIKKDQNFYLNLKKPTLPSFDEEIKI